MTQYEARQELRDAWVAVPFDPERVAKAVAILLELCDYDIVKFAFRGPIAVEKKS